jgi:hypothetical protein
MFIKVFYFFVMPRATLIFWLTIDCARIYCRKGLQLHPQAVNYCFDVNTAELKLNLRKQI